MNKQDMINELKAVRERLRNDKYILDSIIRKLEKELKQK